MTVYIMCGVAGSGKTTFAKELLRTNPNFIYLSSDAIRAEIGTGEDDQSVSRWAFEVMEDRLLQALESGRDVVLDAMFLHGKSRKKFVNIAKRFNVPVTVYVLETPVDVCIYRNRTRDRTVPTEIILKQMQKFRPPVNGDGEVDTVYYVKPNKV